MKNARRDLAIAAAAACFILAFWKLRLVDPADRLAPPSFDMFMWFYPMWHRAAEWMGGGRLPLWNPYQTQGHPFLAALECGVFYPPNAVRLFLSTAGALEVTIVFHLCLAWFFTYAYARGIGLGRASASLAASGFALSGFVVSDTVSFPASASACVWLPLSFLGVEKILRRRGGVWIAVLAAATGLPILAGGLQNWFHSAQALVLYASVRIALRAVRAARAPADRRRSEVIALARAGAGIAGGVLLGLGIAAVQILPSWELQQLGPRRQGGLSEDQALFLGAQPPMQILRNLLDGTPAHPRYGFVGLLALLLAPLAAAHRRHTARVAALVFLATSALLVSMTIYTPVYQWYRWLPGGTWFRGPWRILLVETFALAALAGIGLEWLCEESSRPRRLAAVLAASIAVLVAIVLVSPPPAAYAWLGAGATLLILLAAFSEARAREILAAVLAVGCGVELFAATEVHSVRPWHTPAAFDVESEAFDFVAAHQGLERTYIHTPWDSPGDMRKQGTLRGLFVVGDYEGLTLERYGEFAVALGTVAWKLPYSGRVHIEPRPENLHLLEALSVRFILVGRGDNEFRAAIESEGWRVALDPSRGELVVYEAPNVLPRAYVVFNRVVAPAKAKALQLLRRPQFDLRRSMVVENDEAATGPAVESVTSAREPIQPARIVAYEPTRVSIEAEAAKPGFLVLTDTDYPGWRASVDGREAPIYRANFLFRGVELPAGRHTVEFVFDSTSFKTGASISILSLLGIAAVATCSVPRMKKPRGSGGRARLPPSL